MAAKQSFQVKPRIFGGRLTQLSSCRASSALLSTRWRGLMLKGRSCSQREVLQDTISWQTSTEEVQMQREERLARDVPVSSLMLFTVKLYVLTLSWVEISQQTVCRKTFFVIYTSRQQQEGRRPVQAAVDSPYRIKSTRCAIANIIASVERLWRLSVTQGFLSTTYSRLHNGTTTFERRQLHAKHWGKETQSTRVHPWKGLLFPLHG